MPNKNITSRWAILGSLLALNAFAQTPSSPSPAPAESAFESPGQVDAGKFVPADLMKGPLHFVDAKAENDGLLNTYSVSSGSRLIEVTTGMALQARVREIYALDKLRGMSKTEEFGKAMANAGKKKLKAAEGLVRDPVGTLKRVPQGASRFFGRVGESLKGGGSESESKGVDSLTGVDKVKAGLAVKLGVSPYSANQELQQELTDMSRAMAGGGFVLSGATAMIGGPVLSVLNVNQNLQQTLVNSTPSDLRIINRKKLLALGVSPQNADEFLMHPWFSPWHETIVTDALSTIALNPTAFLRRACEALTEQDADYFQRLAQVFARYHQEKAALRSLRVEGQRIYALDTDRVMVVPLSCDYAIWSENAAGRVEDFVQFAKSHDEIKGIALWVDGKVSERAADELKKRQINLAVDVLAEPEKAAEE